MKNKNFLKKLTAGLLGFVITLGVGAAGYSANVNNTKAVENDTHDFAQSLSQLLNNNASIPSIEIAAQDYSIKQIIITYSWNNAGSYTGKVSASATVGETSFGSGVTTTKDSTIVLSGDATIGATTINFTNNTGSGTGHGTFKVSKVTLVEGGTASADVLQSISVSGNMTKTTYTTDETNWDYTGLVATGTYSESGPKVITDKVTWSATPSTISEGSYKISIKASLNDIESSGYEQTVTVSKPSYIGFVCGTDTSSSTSITKNSVTLKASTFNDSRYYQAYSGTDFVVSHATTNITKIEITFTASGTSNYGPSKVSSVNPGSYTYSGYIGTWTGKAKTITFKNSAQIRMTNIKVYLAEAATLSSIEVKTAPTNTSYTAGNDFNPSGLVITAKYDDNSTADIPYAGNESLFTFNPSTNLAQGTTSVTITYGGKTTTQAITVSAAKTLSSIAISGSLTNTTYYNGATTWKTDGLTVTATYSDASTANVTSSSTFVFKQNGTTSSSPTAGSVSIYASYQTITSQNSVSAAISILGSENNPMTVAQAMTYIDSEEYSNANNMYVIGTISQVDSYNTTYKSIQYWISDDGSTTSQLECYSGKGLNNTDFSSKDDLETGITVTVVGFLKKYYDTYEFDKNNYIVSWNKKAVESISIKTSQTQTAYNVGDTFVAAGLVITVYYDNNTSEDVSYSDHVSDFSFSSVSNQGKVTITYKNDKSCEQTVTLLVIENITTVASAPNTVGKNQTIDPKDVVLNATYNTGDSTTVKPDSVTVDSSHLGPATATATYNAATGTKTATWEVTVVKAASVATIVIADVATEKGWTETGVHTTFTSGGFTFTASGSKSGATSGTYNSNSDDWRIYKGANSGLSITIPSDSDNTFKSITLNPTPIFVSGKETDFTYSTDEKTASIDLTNLDSNLQIVSITIEYYPPTYIEEISLTANGTTITSEDINPSFAITGDTVFTASYNPDEVKDTLTWTLSSATNLSMSGSNNSRTISVGDLKLDGSATLKVESKEVSLEVSITYTHPEKINKSISIPAGQEYKNAYTVGDTLNLSGLTAVIKYTSSIYDDLDVNYNDDPSKFSVTYKYEGYETEYPSTKAFELPDGVEKLDARLTITYTDTYGSVSVRTQVVHVTADIEPVTKLTINNLSHNLDVYDHKTIQMTCEVEPATATDKSVTWESLNEDVATIDENGNVTVVTDTAQSFTIRCTTNGKDENGQPLVKEKTIAIKEHNSISFVYADENGSEITNLDHFEYGKVYTITAIDNNFPDEDEDFTWEKYNGKSSFEFVDNVTTGKTVQIRITAVSGTTAIRLKALIHGKNAITKDGVASTYQPVSSVEISADKTILYTNDTAEITLAVNQYSIISEDIEISVSDESIASVVQNGVNNKFTLTPHKHGTVTASISVDGVESNTLTFNIVETLNPINYSKEISSAVEFVPNDFKNGVTSCTRDGVTFSFTGSNTATNPTVIKILGTGAATPGSYSIDAGDFTITKVTSTANSGKNNGFNQDGINQSTYTKANPNSGQWELKTITVYVSHSEDKNAANANIGVQKKVLEYAEAFNNYASIDSTTWETLKSQYESLINSFETDEEKELAQEMFKYASYSGSSLDTLQQCVKKYDRAYATLGLGDDANFMDRTKIDISATISAEVGFQFTGLDVTKFEFIFTGDYTATNVTEYGFLISTNADALNSCINEKNTSGTGIISFVCEDDEAECVAGVKLEKTSITYYVTFYYIDGSGKHYSEVLEISVDGYLTSDDFNIEDITDPYAKIAIQVYIASLEK